MVIIARCEKCRTEAVNNDVVFFDIQYSTDGKWEADLTSEILCRKCFLEEVITDAPRITIARRIQRPVAQPDRDKVR
jgi:hypothetical protein